MTKKIAVIDGNSLMHRAYHAIMTPMSAKDGTPTNAVFGFMQMFCKFIEDVKPDGVVCAFDAGKPEHRIADLPQYKAQRPHMDEELRVQFPVIEQLLTAMNVPVIKMPGWEGDDILGTIAQRDEALGYESLLVTGDKDACQLATDLTKIVTTKKGITDVVIYGPDEVMEKYGVTPSQFIDYLGLMGDSSDNIPGVPGIGPKSATTLLERYGSIEGVYEHIDELKGKQKENLIENRDLAFLSRQIATIVRDLDVEIDLENLSFPDFDSSVVEEAFSTYALMSPLARVLRFVGEEAQMPVADVERGEVVRGDEAAHLVMSAVEQHEYIGIAYMRGTQDTIFEADIIIAFSTPSGTGLLGGDDALQMLRRCVMQGDIVCLDCKEVLHLLYPSDSALEALITCEDVFNARLFDLGIAAYLLESTAQKYTIEGLCRRYLGGELPEDQEKEDQLTLFAAAARKLRPVLARALEEDGSSEVYESIDLPLIPVLVQMERTGMALDSERLRAIGDDAAGQLKDLSAEIYALAGEEFNIDSPKQLSHILFEVMGLEPIKKNSRGYSTDATVMRELAKTESIAELVMKYRELSKIKGTYIDALPKMRKGDGRVHTVFHQTVTATGRLSSSDPNLQNIPIRTDFGRSIRECFVPLAPGEVFLSADYSQIELRLLASLSEDEHLIKAFLSGADFHSETAARVFGKDVSDITPDLRSRAKAVNFGIVYGQQAYGLSQALDIPMGEAASMIEMYFVAYPKVREYLDGLIEHAAETGYATTMFGRKRHIPELRSSKKQVHGQGERTAMNHPMQGSAADIIKMAMNKVERMIETEGYRAKLIMQVHDELDLSVAPECLDEVAQMVKDQMENVVSLAVPLSAEVSWGDTWAQAH